MAERHRSKDGGKDTDKLIDKTAGISQQGRSGGNLERDVGTQDSLERATSPDAGVTRVTGEDKRNHGTEPKDGDD